MSSHLGSFFLSNKQRARNAFMFAIVGITNDKVFHTDTDPFCMEKIWTFPEQKNTGWKDELTKLNYSDLGFFPSIIIPPKVYYCCTFKDYEVIEDGIEDLKKSLKRLNLQTDHWSVNDYLICQMLERLVERKNWFIKKFWRYICDSFKNRKCEDCHKSEAKTCERCKERIYHQKKQKANWNKLSRKPPSDKKTDKCCVILM